MAEDKKDASFHDPRSIVKGAICNREHWVWLFLAGDIVREGDRHQLRKADNHERKEEGLEPRPWDEIAENLREQLYREIDFLEKEGEEKDAKQQEGEQKGRPIRDFQEYMLLKLLMMNDKRWRKEQGLEPRSWEELKDAFYDGETSPDATLYSPATGLF